MMKILTFSTLYPNAEKPNHGIFVETRLRHLISSGKVESRVVAPVPWFPFKNSRFGQYAHYARVPTDEVRKRLSVVHPRYPVIPKISMTAAPLLLAAAVKPVIRQIIKDGYDFDLIDAHYFYPDGVAAAMLARHFGKPLVITARGTDINLIPQYRLPRTMIQWAARKAASIITVCDALKDELVKLEVDPQKIISLRNGVDLGLFRPLDRNEARERVGMKGFTLLSVGFLDKRKAHDITISALPLLPEVSLWIIGTGPELDALQKLALQLNVAHRVKFLGFRSQNELVDYYSAADAMVLASSREGWANVLLESMACGTPVVASNVWGTPEVVASPAAGVLIQERTPQALADGVSTLRANYPCHQSTRVYAEQFSWEDTTYGQVRLFAHILNQEQTAPR